MMDGGAMAQGGHYGGGGYGMGMYDQGGYGGMHAHQGGYGGQEGGMGGGTAGTTILKLRGLPFQVQDEDIIRWFEDAALGITPLTSDR